MDDSEFFKECFEYNIDSGELIWKVRPVSHFKSVVSCNIFNGKHSGCVAGYKRYDVSYRYIFVKLSGKKLQAHRIVAEMFLDDFSEDKQIDHINGDGHDNSLNNLRMVDSTGNARNQKLNKKSKFGIMGIGLHKGKFRVRINGGNDRIYLGIYDDFFEACCVRKSAETKYGYHSNHGMEREL